MNIPSTQKTIAIHCMIESVCTYMKTAYAPKKHGGYNIFNDGKIHLSTDTYVTNVDASVILPDGTMERVFSCSYNGNVYRYHTGKWEAHLEALYEESIEIRHKKEAEEQEQRRRDEERVNAPASESADAVFS